uniref:Uncharacterized protein n=1 Tax=Tanacetum cinerariifolium TaxID=118510 RepID=A0A699JK05_TANCI|nr:hypothetical protein [Tanacetum cinerariifolium]
MGTIDSMKSVLTQSSLDALCKKFHIPDVVHPKLPGCNDRIRDSPTVGVMDIRADDEAQAIGTNRPKRIRKKMKATDGAGGSTQRPAERFVIFPDTPHNSSTNDADDEVSFVARAFASLSWTIKKVSEESSVSAGWEGPTLHGLASPIEAESAKRMYVPKWIVINDSSLDDPDVCRSVFDHLAPPLLFSQLCSMDYEQLLTGFNVGVAHQTCLCFEVRIRLEHELRGRKTFEDKCAMQAGWLRERDAEIANLKA